MTAIQHLNVALLNGYLEVLDKAVLQQMQNLYVQQSKVYLDEIDVAITERNQAMWQEKCHKMKGSAASAGLSQVYEKLVLIEKSLENWPAKAIELEALKLLNQQALDAFKQWLSME